MRSHRKSRNATPVQVSGAAETAGRSGRWWTAERLASAVAAVIVFLAYLPALRGELVYDDVLFLVNTNLYSDPALWRHALTSPFTLGESYFRPLTLLTFMADLRVWGLTPAALHLTNILLHVANTALVAWLVCLWLRSVENRSNPIWFAPLAAGLVYGLHPALVEAAAWVSGRFDLLATTFVLLAIAADLALERRPTLRATLTGASFLAALLSKEMGVVLLVALPVLHAVQIPRRPLRARGGVYLALALAFVAYAALRVSVLGGLAARAAGDAAPSFSLWTVVRSAAGYAKLALWPFTTLSPIHPPPPQLADAEGWLSVLVVLAWAGGLVWLWRAQPRAGGPALAASAALLPVVNIVPLQLAQGTSLIAERFLATPLALAMLALSFVFAALPRRRVLAGVVAGWLLASIVVVERTIPHWRDEFQLWTWTARTTPDAPLPPLFLSQVHLGRGRWQAAHECADRAVRLGAPGGAAWSNRGLANAQLGRVAEALADYREAVRRTPHMVHYRITLAEALTREAQWDEAGAVLDDALRLRPTHLTALLGRAEVYGRQGRPDLAVPLLQRAAGVAPPERRDEVRQRLALAWLETGDALRARGDFARAHDAFRNAGAAGAAPQDVAFGESSVLIGERRFDDAERLLAAALAQFPDDVRLRYNQDRVSRARRDEPRRTSRDPQVEAQQ